MDRRVNVVMNGLPSGVSEKEAPGALISFSNFHTSWGRRDMVAGWLALDTHCNATLKRAIFFFCK
jgi:hypothetical protein